MSESRFRLFERFLSAIGSGALFGLHAFRAVFAPPWRVTLTLRQMVLIGVRSLPIVSITALFTGMVLAFQTAYQINRFGAEIYVGGIVAMSMFRELGPVLTALVVAGRVGAGITAELGSMRVTEQIDAMESMGVDPFNYLVAPRLVASVLMLPILTIYADFVGYFGGFMVGVFKVGLDARQFIDRTIQIVGPGDILGGLAKTIVFGAIIAVVGCHMGFKSKGGAQGVGQATTLSVVASSILILIADYIMTSILYLVE
jgi:phospholipid/cholesterol/gamma-HCH transport system permease protein